MGDGVFAMRAFECLRVLHISAMRDELDAEMVERAIIRHGCTSHDGRVLRAMRFMAHSRLAQNELDIGAWRTLRFCVSNDNVEHAFDARVRTP